MEEWIDYIFKIVWNLFFAKSCNILFDNFV